MYGIGNYYLYSYVYWSKFVFGTDYLFIWIFISNADHDPKH